MVSFAKVLLPVFDFVRALVADFFFAADFFVDFEAILEPPVDHREIQLSLPQHLSQRVVGVRGKGEVGDLP